MCSTMHSTTVEVREERQQAELSDVKRHSSVQDGLTGTPKRYGSFEHSVLEFAEQATSNDLILTDTAK